MRNSLKIILLLFLFTFIQSFQDSFAAPRIVDNTLGARLGTIFPELRQGYIDLNQNGSLDRLEDMDELVPESRLRDEILQVQEIFDFLIENYRYLPITRLNAVRDALDDPQGAIPEILTINYRTRISALIQEREAMGEEGLYLSPSARRKALATMEDLISRLNLAYQKEWRQAESDFVEARNELFSLLDKGYPLPENLLPEDYDIFESTLINATMPQRAENQERSRTAILTLGKLKSDNAVPYLIDLLRNDTFSREAIRALGAIGTPDAQQILLERLNDESTESPETLECIRALGKIGGKESADTLLDILRTTAEEMDAEKEQEIIGSLSAMASGGYIDRRISSLLTEYLANPDPVLRSIAIRGLSYYTDQASSVQVLNAMKNDRNSTVVLAAVRSAHRINHASTVPTMVGLLRDGNISQDMTREVIEALGQHPDGVRGAVNIQEFLGSPERETRNSARQTLKALYTQNPQVVATSLSRGLATSKDDLYLKEASSLLAELSDSSALNTFFSLLTSSSPEVRKNVTWGLYRIGVSGNLRAQTALQKLVTSETEPLEVRINALRALAKAGEDHPSMLLWQTFATTAKMRGEKYSILRLYSLRGLGALGTINDEVLSVLSLVARGEQDQSLREEAIKALHSIGVSSPAVEKTLAEIASGSGESPMSVRIAALRALGDMSSAETGPAARAILEDEPGQEPKRDIVYSLVKSNSDDAWEVLFDLSADEDVNELLIPFLEEGDPDILEPLINRRLKREENQQIRSILESLLMSYSRGL
ncbi:HEAT repeat domain-containing protein [Marispirochaeta sp.]|uniref:HEAT repeat domain-containing protein n=1 Tax=Marispirochaeta sp. TaxID=2038653 RepID=UPI0029C71615|nr:HEAT repeat domain-containing protein [Marispirochaeta sp.]